jgi:hypothetical protein
MQCDADTGSHGTRVSVDHDGRRQCDDEAICHQRRAVWIGNAGKDEGELVTAHACRGVHLAAARPQPFGGDSEHLISRLVTVGVVDGLEPVQVACQRREAVSRPAVTTHYFGGTTLAQLESGL